MREDPLSDILKGAFEIKKELSEEEFRQIIAQAKKRIEEAMDLDQLAGECEDIIPQITSAKKGALVVVRPDERSFFIPSKMVKIPMEEGEDSLLIETYRSKNSLLVNDVKKSFLYNPKIDNIFDDTDLKSLMLVPVVEKGEVVAILWAAIPSQSWDIFTQKDLDYLTRFSMMIKKPLLTILRRQRSSKEGQKEERIEVESGCEYLQRKLEREREYFSSIIHDIRNPMNAIMGFLELMARMETDTQKREYFDMMLQSGRSMITLINDALDMAKIHSGKMKVVMEEFDPLHEFSDTARLYFNMAREKHIDFRTFFDPLTPKKISSDAHRIKQIINNLLSNAIKFTPEKGQIDFFITYDKESDSITVMVKDTGPGISPERQKDIFSPFVQEKDTTSKEYGGTGLGLSISRQLAVLLGGKLWLESEVGKGSAFYVQLPCHTPAGTPPAINPSFYKEKCAAVIDGRDTPLLQRYLERVGMGMRIVQEKGEGCDIHIADEHYFDKIPEPALLIADDPFTPLKYLLISGHSKMIYRPLLPYDLFGTISLLLGEDSDIAHEVVDERRLYDATALVIDDNPINLKLMQEILRSKGLQVQIASNGKDALDMAQRDMFDIVFVDHNMPKMSGTQIIEKIKELQPETIFMGLTGDASNDVKKEFEEAGAKEVLLKPVKIDTISEILERYLSHKRM
jgi:signal transduction histidine kinase/ActR/RegA family two-component response regulator